MDKEITLENLKKYKKAFEKNQTNKIRQYAVMKNGVFHSAFNQAEAAKLPNVFSDEIENMSSVLAQKASGRCWMFAATNVVRKNIAKSLGLNDIELSESYLMFYDKLEKTNLKLQKVIDNIDKEFESYEIKDLTLAGGDFDGGYFHYFKNLVDKYGVCPKAIFPETDPSSNSREMDAILNMLIGKDMVELKDMYNAGSTVEELVEAKNEMLKDIYQALAICLGTPVDKFEFDYYADVKGKKTFKHIKCTPQEFAKKYITINLDDYILIISHNDKNYPYYEKYMQEYSINMYNEEYFGINVPIEELKDYAIRSIKDQNPVWFTCDVGSFGLRQEGLLSTKAVDLEGLFGLNLRCNKFNRVLAGSSFWNHAMTLTGVNLEHGKPNRWKVQNSWGTEVGDQGIFVASDDWFDEFVYQIVVDKKYLSEKAQQALNKETKILEHNRIVA